ncbi:HTH-type transcriptional repressor ComR [subsurface metagenome]
MPWEKQFDRDAALEKAMLTFWARGYEATSVQDLVDSMGLNRGSLYATFGDKHALFLEALRMYDREVRERLLKSLREKFPPKVAVRELLRTFERQPTKNSPGNGCFLTNTALELAAHDKEARKIVAESQEQIETFFAEAIKAGQHRGDIDREIPPQGVARGLLATFIGLVVLTRSRPEPALLRSIVDDAIRRLG